MLLVECGAVAVRSVRQRCQGLVPQPSGCLTLWVGVEPSRFLRASHPFDTIVQLVRNLPRE